MTAPTYFSNLPTSLYDFKDQQRTITNVWNRVHYKMMGKFDFATMCQKYTMEIGDTPTSVSIKLYGTQDFYWTLFVVNVRRDYVADFPLSEEALKAYCIEKYGNPEWIEGIHHFEDRRGFVVDSVYIDIDGFTIRRGIPVSNWYHESKLNDKKREIYVIKPYYVSSFASQFMGAMNG